MKRVPYQRAVAFAAGPIAILAGWLATWLEVHAGVLDTLGVQHDKIAAAIVIALTFTVGATVTYLAHAHWVANLAKWWTVNIPAAAGAPAATSAPVLAEIDHVTAQLQALQAAPGTPADVVGPGLSPDP